MGVVMKGGVIILGHLSWGEDSVLPKCSPIFSVDLGRDGPKKWRKIGDHKEDLQGIPACKAEIGN